MANQIGAAEVDQTGHDVPVMANEVIIVLDGRDIHIPMANLGVSLESTENEILAAVRPVAQEEHGANIADEHGNVAYTVRKAMNSGTIHVYPKPVMG